MPMRLFRNHKPEWIYELLPWLYVGAGLLTIVVIQNAMSVFSGLALVSAGVSVLLLRRHHRSHDGNGQPAGGNAASTNLAEATFKTLVWRSSYECGHRVIDEQHRGLFDLGNELIDAIVEGDPRPRVEALIDDFVHHIGEHFATEEALMNMSSDPISRQHQDSHHELLNQATELNRRFRQGARVSRDLVNFIAFDVVAKHLIQEDPQAIRAALGRN